jgi:hypothetical protein
MYRLAVQLRHVTKQLNKKCLHGRAEEWRVPEDLVSVGWCWVPHLDLAKFPLAVHLVSGTPASEG